jgi:hypothetical protein
LTFGNVLPHCIAPLRKHVLKKSAAGHQYVVVMTKFNQISNCGFRHEGKRAAGKL